MPNTKATKTTKATKSPATKVGASKVAASKAATKSPASKAATKAPASKAATKPPATKKAAPVTTPAVPVVKPVVTEPAVVVTPVLQDDFASILSKLQQVNAVMTSIRTEVRALEKKAAREIKIATKSKPKPRKGNRAPSGFVMPAKISNELASFLGKDQGTEMARTEVTREINAYIREHKLQDSNNGRKINPDALLAKLLKVGDGDELTYFNLQRYMSPHFAKAVKKEAPST